MKKKVVSALLATTLSVSALAGSTMMVSAEESAKKATELLDGKKVAYIANECASDWQSISTKYLETLVESAGGESMILTMMQMCRQTWFHRHLWRNRM